MKEIYNQEKMDDKELYFMSILCEQSERYGDMLNYMFSLLEKKQSFNVNERNLFSVAFTNTINKLRTSLKILKNIEMTEQDKLEENVFLLISYKQKIEQEIDSICREIIKNLDDVLIKNSLDNYSDQVFYYKMKGDVYRYLAEIGEGEKNSYSCNQAFVAY